MFKLYFERHLLDFFGTSRRRVLDVGPDPYSCSFFPAAVDYVSFDLRGTLALVRGDLTHSPFPDAGFDSWICSHVLDVIPDDTAAMRELHRVLHPRGVGILDNAMTWQGQTHVFENPHAAEYWRLRRYGSDLIDRLRGVGFAVEIIDPSQLFDSESIHRYGLRNSPFLLCRHSNPSTEK